MIKKLPMESSSSFYIKLYELVDDRSSDAIISWNKSNNQSFVVWELKRLQREVLPKSSLLGRSLKEFMAQLRSRGFKVTAVKGPGELEFSHEDFAKGLLKKMLLKDLSDRINKFDAEIKSTKFKIKTKKATLKVDSLFQNLRI